MSFKVKLIVAAVLVIALAGGTVACAAGSLIDVVEPLQAVAEGQEVIQVSGATMTVDKSNLHFTVEKNGIVWDSGKKSDDDPDEATTAIRNVQDAVRVGYRQGSISTSLPLTASATVGGRRQPLGSVANFSKKSDGFEAKINTVVGISFKIKVKLVDDGVIVSVPQDSIEEKNEKYQLEHLILYSGFDCSYKLVDGSILIPDGSGALIDMSQPTRASTTYSARVYGADYGITNAIVRSNSPYKASLPLFAMLYNNHGTMVTAESGAEFCSVNATVSPLDGDYNMGYFKWHYREEYTKYFQSAGTDGSSYVAFQEDMNKLELVQKMTFLEGKNDVVDVAKRYRDSHEFKQHSFGSNAGLRINFLMSENKMGMFGSEVVRMTTTDFIAQKAQEITNYCNNLYVSVSGYTRGGLNGSYPNHFPLEGKTGGNRGYSDLSKTLDQIGVRFSMVTDFVKAYADSNVNERNLALNMSTQFITVNDNRSGSDAKFNLVNIDYAAENIKNASKNFSKYTTALDYQSIGEMLYSGYENNVFDRIDTAKAFVQAVKDAGFDAYIERPNEYMWAVCDGYLDMPVASSGYLIETQSVPLLQMILSGKMEMYSQSFNLNYTGVELTLRLIDYNVYPSFILTENDSVDLYGTNSSGIFTSKYSLWENTVKDVYTTVNNVLSAVSGQTVTNRLCVGNGVYATVYSNGVTVVVNYTDANVTYAGVEIPAQSAQAIR